MKERLRRFGIRFGALAAKEVLHIRRDPRTLYLALVMPVVLLLIFGYGVSFDIDRIPVAVVDLDQTATSRRITRDLFASNEIVSAGAVAGADEAEQMLRSGKALGFITLPAGTASDLSRGESVAVGLVVDGRDTVVANALLAKAEAIVRAAGARQVTLDAPAAAPISVEIWTRFNPEGRSALYFVPGLAAYLLSIASVLLTALAIATEWERGSMEQLFASPVGRLEIILGKIAPYLAIGALQLLLVLSVGAWAFDVPIRGSLGLLFGAGLLFLLGVLGQGLLISVLTRNQLVATQAGALSSLLPSLLLSGFVFPIENMPWALRAISAVVPARYMVHALRSIMLKGEGFGELWQDFLALALFALAILTLATARFRRRLA